MTPDADDLCVFAVKRGSIEKKEIYCNPRYPFYLALVEKYRNSPYAFGKMSDYVEVNPKTDCSTLSDETQVSFIPMANVQEKNNTVSYDLVPYSRVKKGFTVFQRNDLIWAKITPCMQNGKSCIVEKMPTNIGFGSTEFHVIRRRSDDIYMPFLWAVFANDNVLKAAQATFSGTAGQQRVSASFIENFPAVLPSIEVQKRLASRLEDKLNAMNQKLLYANHLLIERNRIILDSLGIVIPTSEKSIISAVLLRNIIEDKTLSTEYYHPERMAAIHAISNGKHLTVKKLSDIVSFHRDIVSSADSPETYLGLAGVQSQTGELSGVIEEATGQAFEYKAGDILYGRLRPYLNKVLLAETSGICSTEFHVMRIKDSSEVLPGYLAAILRSDLILSQTKHMMTGNTHPRISNDDVKNLYIPIPSLSVQRRIEEELQRRRTEARTLKQQAENEWTEAKAQFEKELLGE